MKACQYRFKYLNMQYYIIVFRKHMQLVLRSAKLIRAKHRKRRGLEKGVSEVQNENIRLGVVVPHPVLCKRTDAQIATFAIYTTLVFIFTNMQHLRSMAHTQYAIHINKA
jgi:hypothetical protein